MKSFVLVGDDQVPASPRDVLAEVQEKGFKAAGQKFGFSESTLRKFLAENHYVAVKQVTYKKNVDLMPESTPIEMNLPPGPKEDRARANTTTSPEAQVVAE
jgi:hypothetical protein